MPEESSNGSWLSAHLFFQGDIYSETCDRIVLDLVRHFVARCYSEGWIDRYFFIRYNEFGPHVRLRMYGKPHVIEGTVRPALTDLARTFNREVDIAEGIVAPAVPRVRAGLHALHWIAYVPETERYGGPSGIHLAERFFHASSEAAIALLANTKDGQRSTRLGKGLLAMVVLLRVFLETRAAAAAFANHYATSYLRALIRDEEMQSERRKVFNRGYEQQSEVLMSFLNEVWSRMDCGESLSGTLDGYASSLYETRERLQALCVQGRLAKGTRALTTWHDVLRSIVPSYVHMMNNRLGITISEEAYLGHLIHRAIELPTNVDPR